MPNARMRIRRKTINSRTRLLQNWPNSEIWKVYSRVIEVYVCAVLLLLQINIRATFSYCFYSFIDVSVN